MADSNWDIPKSIDAPHKILIFGAGEFVLLVLAFGLGIVLDFFIYGMLGAAVIITALRLLKKYMAGITFDVVVYWWFGFGSRSIPPSYKRFWRG